MTATGRVLVVGTGAMASLFAARLQRFGGARVTLTGTWPEALAAIATHGVRVEDGTGAWSARPDVAPLGAAPGPVDVALVLVKSYQTAAVAATLPGPLGPEGHAVTLQNGLGNREALEAAMGPERVAMGVTTAGATLLRPGCIRALAGTVTLGATASPPPILRAFRERLVASGFETAFEPDIERAVWRKLAVNCAINPLSALAACPNGGLLERADLRHTLIAAAREVGAVAAARGTVLDVDPADLALQVAESTAANRSSMLQDVLRGARTEIEALNGAVVREARRLGTVVPVNEGLLRDVLELEARAARGMLA